jgi:hypothetical protein
MSDLISREETIKTIMRSSVYAWSVEQDQIAHEWAIGIIEAIPSADRPKWIPCSKRLPKEPRGNWEIENYLTCNEDGNIYILSWANGWNCCFNSDGSLYKDQVITDIVAWMPLPEAYREDEQ